MKWIGESESGRELVEMSRDEFGLFVATQCREEADVGAAVRKWRHKNGVSQTELAKRAGISRNYVSQIETGEAANVSYRVYQSLMAEIRKGGEDKERESREEIEDMRKFLCEELLEDAFEDFRREEADRRVLEA